MSAGAVCSDGHRTYDVQCPSCWEAYLRGDWTDVKDEWSAQIREAFPTRSGSHAEYATAMKMVGHRHSKGELVALVNWLLVRLASKEKP